MFQNEDHPIRNLERKRERKREGENRDGYNKEKKQKRKIIITTVKPIITQYMYIQLNTIIQYKHIQFSLTRSRWLVSSTIRSRPVPVIQVTVTGLDAALSKGDRIAD